MADIIRLLYGRDRRDPIRSLDVSTSTGELYVQVGGFETNSGRIAVNYSGGNPRRDGEKRISSRRSNTILTINYAMVGNSRAEIGSLQAAINRFFTECGLYEENVRLEPVWLQVRWDDGLVDVPEPVYGQMSQYYRVLAGEVPAWPGDVWRTPTAQGGVNEVVCRLTCEPFAMGLPQLAAIGVGQLEITDDGLSIFDGITNLFANPTFGHPSDFDNGWSASDATLKVVQETRPTFTKYLQRGVQLTNTDTTNDREFTQTLTLTAADYVCSWLIKKTDSSAVTTADVNVVIQGAVQTTSYISLADGWYLVYAAATAAASSSTHGLEVKAGKQVFASAAQIELASGSNFGTNNKPSPICAGHLLGCSWSGTAHESSSTRPDTIHELPLSTELTGLFTVSFLGNGSMG